MESKDGSPECVRTQLENGIFDRFLIHSSVAMENCSKYDHVIHQFIGNSTPNSNSTLKDDIT